MANLRKKIFIISLFWLLALFISSHIKAAELPPTREKISLNGVWAMLPIKLEEKLTFPPDETRKWREVNLPFPYWEDTGFRNFSPSCNIFMRENSHQIWFKKDFLIPEAMKK